MPIRSIALVGFIGLSVACGGAVDPGAKGDDLSAHGLSPQIMKAVRAYREFEAEMLARPMTQGRFESFASGTQRRIDDMKIHVKTDADRNVLLILALTRAKDAERFRLVLLKRPVDDPEVQEIPVLYEARQVCQDELHGWIESIETDTASLEEGECLAEAMEMAEDLGLEPPS